MAVRVRSRALGTALPSAETKWERRVAGDATRRLATLVLPSVDRTTGFVLREAPALRDRGDGAPIVQLLLLLDRKPSAGDEDVSPYVQGGVLNVEVTTAVPGWALDALAEADGRTYEPLFVRSGLLELRGGTGQERRILSQVECSGSSPGGALSLSLDRADALAALGAFDGEATSLSIRAALQFLASTPALDIRLRGRWSDVYDAFAERANEGVLGVPQIADAVGALLETANLFVESLSNGAGDEELSLANREPIVDGLLRVSAVVLERLDPSLAPTDPTARYRLRSRPNEAFPLDATLRTSSSLLRTVVVEAPIEAMLDGVLGGRERSQFLQLQFPSAGNGRIGFEEPRRLASRVDGAPIGSRGHETTALSALDGTFRSLTHSMRPRAARPPAAALLASNLVRPPQAIRFDRLSQNWWLDDLVIGVDQRPRHLPIVDAIDAPLWKDRLDAARRWYAPVFTLVDPERNQSAETSPYTFSVRRIGTTAEGRPALVGSISFRLRRTPSRDTQAAIESEPNAHAAPVPHLGLSVALSIPYLDERDNSLERRSLPATITEDGELVHARVDLINEVLRLAYGALAVEGFQSEAARVEVAYSYEAYVPIEGREVDWVAGHARAAVALADHDARRELRPLALATMPVGPHRPSGVAAASAHLRPTPAALSVLAASLPAHVVASGRPPSQVLAEAIRRTRYASRSLVRQNAVEILYPCSLFGALYLQDTGEGPKPVGCVDALELGRASVRQYSEAPELSDPAFRVFRSLLQPGRFLVLPEAYRVTRFGPDLADKAFRPAIAVYSSLDPSTGGNNRVMFHATLEPDVSVHARWRLLERLRAEAADAIVEWPTEIDAELACDWIVGSSFQVEARLVKGPDHLQVTFATDLTGALLLRSMLETQGIAGDLEFHLPDGSTLRSSAAVDLRAIIGPWAMGPVDPAIDNDAVVLTNRIERPVDVSDLLVQRPDGSRAEIPVERQLAPAESVRIASTGAVAKACAAAAPATDAPVSLEEIRSLVDEIRTSVIFVDLIDHAAHEVAVLLLEVQMKDVPGTYDLSLAGEPPRGTVEFILPLTTYLAGHVLEFRVHQTLTDGSRVSTPWLSWDLEARGNVVSLTWELIATKRSPLGIRGAPSRRAQRSRHVEG